MLAVDPQQRISAKKALMHPFIKKYLPSQEEDFETAIDEDVTILKVTIN
jgi:serine/threonine protein kinase